MSNKMIEDLNWRYACKKFDADKKISDEDFNTLMDALRLTASSYGIQPWRFVVVKNEEMRKELVGASWGQAQVADASHLIVMCRPSEINEKVMNDYIEDIAKTRGQNISELDGFKGMIMKLTERAPEVNTAWAKNQIYIALGNLLTVCASMKIDSCPMEGFKPSKYDEILGLEAMGLKSVLVCPVGYRAEDDKYVDIKKVRYAMDTVVKTIE